MSEEILMKLSTRVQSAKKIEVDGEPFDLLGLEHLSEDDEIKVSALFARHEYAGVRLGAVTSQHEAESIAKQMRNMRLDILTVLTTIPKETVRKIPLPQQIELLDLLRLELEAGREDEDGGGAGAS